jgi:ribonucleoside-triphosphate reductase
MQQPTLFDSSHLAGFFKPSLVTVRKRDGREEAFDATKIVAAIAAAGKATGEFDHDAARRLTARVITVMAHLYSDAAPTVEQVQDAVEDVLLASDYKRSAKAYIIYREQHARMREIVSAADIDLVEEYLERKDWKVSENSNMAYSLQGLNNYISSEVSKVYWLNKIYPREVREAHIRGDMHIHDLNLLSVYCVGWDLRDLLLSGFSGAPAKAESKPARHFRTALGQVVNFFYTLQGEAAGAQAFSSFDTLLAPYISYDGLEQHEVKQALQEFVFNLNVPTRVGFQTPFTNLTLDLKVSPIYANEPVIIGGELKDRTYGEFQREMDMLNRALFEVLTEGDAKGRVFTFPIPTVNIGRDFDWDTPNLDPLWEATARYGIPYFSNFVNSDLSPEDARSMCCRLRLDLRTLERRGGGLFGANPLTGSIGVVTINMPRLGYLSQTEEEFFGRLAVVMDLAKSSLEIKRKALERFSDANLYPYTKFFLRQVKERFGKYWHNHFSTIGLVGVNEACLNLLGVDLGTEPGRAFAIRVLDFMRERLQQFQEQTGQIFNLEATPAEGAGYRLAKIDSEKLPGIISGNAEGHGKPFYNNSTQLPVDYSDDVFEVFDLQDDIQTRYTGGTVLHVFSGEGQVDPSSVKQFVRTVCDTYRLPYFTFTPTFSVCPEHGYLTGKHETCPTCGIECEVYSRVVGYLRPVSQWNEGKAEEFKRRSSFDICCDGSCQ